MRRRPPLRLPRMEVRHGGPCVDMPNEPAESDFKSKIRATAYPCAERAGVVWAYLGPADSTSTTAGSRMAGLPERKWARPSVCRRPTGCRRWRATSTRAISRSPTAACGRTRRIRPGPAHRPIRKLDKHPRFEVVRTRYGTCIGAGRNAPEDHRYWRITQHLMPFHTMTGPYGKDPLRNWRAWVPIDDTSCVIIGVTFHPRGPDEDERSQPRTPNWRVDDLT